MVPPEVRPWMVIVSPPADGPVVGVMLVMVGRLCRRRTSPSWTGVCRVERHLVETGSLPGRHHRHRCCGDAGERCHPPCCREGDKRGAAEEVPVDGDRLAARRRAGGRCDAGDDRRICVDGECHLVGLAVGAVSHTTSTRATVAGATTVNDVVVLSATVVSGHVVQKWTDVVPPEVVPVDGDRLAPTTARSSV